MKQQYEMYAIIPPDESYLDDFQLKDGLGLTEDKAWDNFCYPALRREGYESDGFAARKVIVTIEENTSE